MNIITKTSDHQVQLFQDDSKYNYNYGSICPKVVSTIQDINQGNTSQIQQYSKLTRTQSARAFTKVRPVSHYQARAPESKVVIRFIRPRTGRPKSAVQVNNSMLNKTQQLASSKQSITIQNRVDNSNTSGMQTKVMYGDKLTDTLTNLPFPQSLNDDNLKPIVEANFSRIHKNLFDVHSQQAKQVLSIQQILQKSKSKQDHLKLSISDLKKIIRKDERTLSKSASTQEMRVLIARDDYKHQNCVRKPSLYESRGEQITQNKRLNRVNSMSKLRQKLDFKLETVTDSKFYDENDPDLKVINDVIPPSQQRKNSLVNHILYDQNSPTNLINEYEYQEQQLSLDTHENIQHQQKHNLTIQQTQLIPNNKDQLMIQTPRTQSHQSAIGDGIVSSQQTTTRNYQDNQHLTNNKFDFYQQNIDNTQQINQDKNIKQQQKIQRQRPQTSRVQLTRSNTNNDLQVKMYNKDVKGNPIPNSQIRYHQSKKVNQALKKRQNQMHLTQLIAEAKLLNEKSQSMKYLLQQKRLIPNTANINNKNNTNQQVYHHLIVENENNDGERNNQEIMVQMSPRSINIFDSQNVFISINPSKDTRSPRHNNQHENQDKQAIKNDKFQVSVRDQRVKDRQVVSQNYGQIAIQNLDFSHTKSQNQVNPQQQLQQSYTTSADINQYNQQIYQFYLNTQRVRSNQSANFLQNSERQQQSASLYYQYPINLTERGYDNTAGNNISPDQQDVYIQQPQIQQYNANHQTYQAESFPMPKRKRPISAYLNTKSYLIRSQSAQKLSTKQFTSNNNNNQNILSKNMDINDESKANIKQNYPNHYNSKSLQNNQQLQNQTWQSLNQSQQQHSQSQIKYINDSQNHNRMQILLKNKYIQQQINNLTGSITQRNIINNSTTTLGSNTTRLRQQQFDNIAVSENTNNYTNNGMLSNKQKMLSEYLQRIAKSGKYYDKNFKRKPVYKVMKKYSSKEGLVEYNKNYEENEINNVDIQQ